MEESSQHDTYVSKSVMTLLIKVQYTLIMTEKMDTLHIPLFVYFYPNPHCNFNGKHGKAETNSSVI